MYRNEKWQDDKLYIQSNPNGPWREATPQETITHLRERVLALEEAVRRLQTYNSALNA